MRNNRKVIAFLNGGIGNQMFEYALALGVAERIHAKLVLDVSGYWLYRFRKLNLMSFVGPARRTSKMRNLLWSCVLWFVRVVARRMIPQQAHAWLEKFSDGILNIDRVSASSAWVYDPCFMNPNLGGGKNVLILGIYQFLPSLASRDVVIGEFALSNPASAASCSYLKQIEDVSVESVSIHVRRGDYTGISMVLPISYYRQAIARLTKSRDGLQMRYFFFSDDPDWCRKEFADLQDAIFVEGDTKDPTEDLRLMIACKHHIIANSTFSFWGAYLSVHDSSSMTFCPAKWSPDFATPSTMIPREWLLVKSFEEGGA